MYAIRNEALASDSESNFDEDEDELTRIIPPEGTLHRMILFKYLYFLL